jgi:hypothetical protein
MSASTPDEQTYPNHLTVDSLRQEGLRERRPSGTRPNNLFGFTSLSTSSAIKPDTADESAIEDDEHPIPLAESPNTKHPTISLPSPLVHPDHHFSSTVVPERSLPQTPYATTPGNLTPTHTGQANLFDQVDALALTGRVKPERYKARLASGFLFFFCAGWSDGSTYDAHFDV